jgi:hypothetical protein
VLGVVRKTPERVTWADRKAKSKKQLARLTVTLGERDYSEICQFAEKNDVSAAWVIRRAVQQYLGQVPPPSQRAPSPKQPGGRS